MTILDALNKGLAEVLDGLPSTRMETAETALTWGDLGCDSVQAGQVLVCMEEMLGVSLEEGRYASLSGKEVSISQVVAAFAERMGATSA